MDRGGYAVEAVLYLKKHARSCVPAIFEKRPTRRSQQAAPPRSRRCTLVRQNKSGLSTLG